MSSDGWGDCEYKVTLAKELGSDNSDIPTKRLLRAFLILSDDICFTALLNSTMSLPKSVCREVAGLVPMFSWGVRGGPARSFVVAVEDASA